MTLTLIQEKLKSLLIQSLKNLISLIQHMVQGRVPRRTNYTMFYSISMGHSTLSTIQYDTLNTI